MNAIDPNTIQLANIIAAQLAAEMSKHFTVQPTLTLDQAAAELGISNERMRQLCQNGDIPFIRMDRLYRIKPADINNYLESHYQKKDPAK